MLICKIIRFIIVNYSYTNQTIYNVYLYIYINKFMYLLCTLNTHTKFNFKPI